MDVRLPENVTPLSREAQFHFSCHSGAPCFTECCRALDLALTPFDVLRLKNALSMHSDAFLAQYVIMERGPDDAFPHAYLTMVDDGRASCPFVSDQGCRVYKNRPGACRIYPVGRGASLRNGSQETFHVLIKEPHCRGFAEPQAQDIAGWIDNQGLESYNQLNDELMQILQHKKIQQGMKLNNEQAARYVLALYNLDTFRGFVAAPSFTGGFPLTDRETKLLREDDVALLRIGMRWLLREFFSG